MKISKTRIREIIREEILNYSLSDKQLNEEMTGSTNDSLIRRKLEDYKSVIDEQDELIREIIYSLASDDNKSNDTEIQKITNLHKAYKQFIEDLIKYY